MRMHAGQESDGLARRRGKPGRLTRRGWGLALLAGANVLAGAERPPGYTVATWPGFCEAAVSYTFDDSCSNQFALAVPMFTAADLRLTLFSCTETMFAGWPALQAAAAEGHEVASHTATHTKFNSLTDEQQTHELVASKEAIEAHVAQPAGLTIAYPYCVKGNLALDAQYYLAGRVCWDHVADSTPADFWQIPAIGCGSLSSVQTSAHLVTWAENAAQIEGWAVFLLHGIDDDGGYSPFSSAELQQSVDFFAAHRERFWVDTFGRVVRYIRERDALTIVETSMSENEVGLSVGDGLDDTVYSLPVTVRRVLPASWEAAEAWQAGQPVPARHRVIEGQACVEFDVVPDGGAVVLRRRSGVASLVRSAVSRTGTVTAVLEGPVGTRQTLLASTDLTTWTPVESRTLEAAESAVELPVEGSARFFVVRPAAAAAGSAL